MKRILLILFCFCKISLCACSFLVETKASVFCADASILQDIYDSSWINHQVEFSFSPFSRKNPAWWGHFYLWNSSSFLRVTGECLGSGSYCDIQVNSISTGLKYILPLPIRLDLYISVAPRYFFVHINNQKGYHYIEERISGIGGYYSVGVLFHSYKNVITDLFCDYSSKQFKKKELCPERCSTRKNLNISGYSIGLGFGLVF